MFFPLYRTLVLLVLFLTGSVVHAAGYTLIEEGKTPSSPGRIEITEYFWYGCPHCFQLHQYVEQWRRELPPGVDFVYVPVALKPEWVDHARVFHAVKTLGFLDHFHPALFDAIHKEKRKDLGTADGLAAFAAQLAPKYTAEEIKAAMLADEVDRAVVTQMDWTSRDEVSSTPTLVINGRYRITPNTAGGYAQMLSVADEIIRKHLGQPDS